MQNLRFWYTQPTALQSNYIALYVYQWYMSMPVHRTQQGRSFEKEKNLFTVWNCCLWLLMNLSIKKKCLVLLYFFSVNCLFMTFIYFSVRLFFFSLIFLLLLFLSKFIYSFLFLAALGLRCCAQAFSSYGEWGLLFIVVRGLIIAVASLVAEHGL